MEKRKRMRRWLLPIGGLLTAIVGFVALTKQMRQRKSGWQPAQPAATTTSHSQEALVATISEVISHEEPVTPMAQAMAEAVEAAHDDKKEEEKTLAPTNDGRQYIGNVRTHIYHADDSDHLPQPENRIFFASEEEAIKAGYRKAANEAETSEHDEASMSAPSA